MNQESNNKELLAELETYQWKNIKRTILKELDLRSYLPEYNRVEIIPLTLFDTPFIIKQTADLISRGYTADEILRAIREWVNERLDEIKIEKEGK